MLLSDVGLTFPQADLVFDRFHVNTLMNGAADTAREPEQKPQPDLKKSRDVRLKNEGLLEGLNSLVPAANARAPGARSARKMIVVMYLQVLMTGPDTRHVSVVH